MDAATDRIIDSPEEAIEHGYVGSLGTMRRSGMTWRQLDYWTRSGLLLLAPREREVSGSPRWYSLDEVTLARVVVRLLDAGATIALARLVIPALRERGALSGIVLIARDGSISDFDPEAIAEGWYIDLDQIGGADAP